MTEPDDIDRQDAAADGADEKTRLSRITPQVYEELRRLARHYMAREHRALTLQATALVNEAWLRLQARPAAPWRNHAHFCAIAAHIMREVLVEHARARAAQKRGGSRVRVSLSDVCLPGHLDGAIAAADKKDDEATDVIWLHAALERLEAQDAELGRLVELRFFGGLSIEETAAELACSPATVKRGWTLARAWLRRELEGRHGA